MLIIIVVGIYLFTSKKNNNAVTVTKFTINDYNTRNKEKLLVESLSEVVTEKPLKKTSKNDRENSIEKEKKRNEIKETKNKNLNNISIPFFHAKNIGELVEWIKSADNNDPRKHFLNVVHQRKAILVVKSKDKEYKLQSIIVHPDNEYMSYTFKKDSDYIGIVINLSDSMKQQMSSLKKEVSISKAVSKYNEELSSIYKNLKLKEKKVKILNQKISIFYNDGKFYEKIDGNLKLVAPSAFFELNDVEIRMNLYGRLKEEKWDDKYLELFKFESVQLFN